MHMYAERFSADLLGMYSGGVGEPVVGMDDVELFSTRHYACNDRVVVDFVVQVARIASGKLHGTQVVDVHVVEVGIDMVAQLEIIVGVHNVAHAVANIVVVDVAPGDGHGIHGNDACGMGLFVAEGVGQA